MTLRVAAEQALEALTNCSSEYGHRCNRCDSEVDEGGRVADALRAALAAEQPQPVCPHIRSSGVGDHATHWCALNGPPSAPQPEAQPVATLHDDGYWTWKRDDFRRQYETQRAGWRMDVFSAPPPAAPGPSEAQDAARYRWLRAGREGVEFRDGDGKWRADCPGGDDLDQIIDAALRAAAAARSPEPSEAQDAARYRWLRDHRGGGHAVVNGNLLEGAELDENIDSMRAAAAARSPEPSEAQDAARYRWLRDPKNADRDEWNMFGPYSSPADIDAAIDDALRAAAAARNTNPA